MNELSTISVKDMAPEQLGGEIRLLTAQARRMALSYGIQIGYRLKIAHEKVGPHGWAEWLKRETEFSAAAASRFESLYEGYGDEQGSIFGVENKFPTLEKLSISNALRLLAIPEEEREDFALEVDAERLSARELEAKVKERTAELEAEKEKILRSAQDDKKDMLFQIDTLKDDKDSLTKARDEAEKARAEVEEQLRQARAELEELEKRPQTVAPERDEAAIAEEVEAALQIEREHAEKEKSRAIKDAVQAEREELGKERGKLEAKIAALEEQAKKNDEILRSAQDDAKKAQNAEAETVRLQRDVEVLKKQLSMAAPAVAEFKAAFDRAQDELVNMTDALHRIEDEKIKGKLRKAYAAMLDSFAGGVKE